VSQEETKKNVLTRLKTIKGHIAGIEKMVEDDKCCDDILLQLAAIKASVHKVGLLIIEERMMGCLDTDETGNAVDKASVEKLLKSLIQYVK